MENLNKENFFNEIQLKYPKAMDQFRKWIDEYKSSVFWDILFCNQTYIKPGSKFIKFHDIPFEMQVGIIDKFFHEVGAPSEFDIVKDEWSHELKDRFKRLNNKL